MDGAKSSVTPISRRRSPLCRAASRASSTLRVAASRRAESIGPASWAILDTRPPSSSIETSSGCSEAARRSWSVVPDSICVAESDPTKMPPIP